MAELNETKYPTNIRSVSPLNPVSLFIYRDDVVLECDTSFGPISLDLLGIPFNYWSTQYKLYIVDKSNNASVNNIKINAGNGVNPTTGLPVAQSINDASFVTINTNGGGCLIRIIDNYTYISTFNSGLNSTLGYTTIQEEGVSLPQRNTLNFIGKAVTATDNVTKTDVTISAYYQVEDEGIAVTQRDTLNFVGEGVNVTDNLGKTQVTINGGALGGIQTATSISGQNFAPQAVGIRTISSGTIQTSGWVAGNSYGTLLSAFNPLTGVFTVPTTGYYDLNTFISLSADVSPFNNLTSASNPNGFVGNGAPPINSYLIGATPQTLDFNDYFGRFTIGVTDYAGGGDASIIYCSNTLMVYYDTSHIVISATYTGRFLTAGTTICVRWLNKCTNTIVGQVGNSFHFSATHIK